MVTPVLSQKQAITLTTREMAKRLFRTVYFEGQKQEKTTDEAKIKVSDTISRMSFYYEKIRNSVDYKEENLMLKEAINRILKRLISIEMMSSSQEIAKDLLTELIRAGYLANNKIPETKSEEVAVIIKKYIDLRAVAQERATVIDRNELGTWIINLVACEVEDFLHSNKVNEMVVNSMYQTLEPLIELPAATAGEARKDLEIQLYLSIYRNYLRADEDMLSFVLFKYLTPDWLRASDEIIRTAGEKIDQLVETIHYQMTHPLAYQLNKITARYTVYMSMLTEVISENPVEVYDGIKKDPKSFPRRIKQVCGKRYKSVKRKLWRAAIRSIIYLFLTKMLLVFILEIPAANLLDQPVSDISLLVNVTFPPLLLFMIVLFTRMPGETNTAKIVEGIEQLVYVEKERREPFKIKVAQPRSQAKSTFFNILYAVTFFVSFGAVVYVLDQINFHFISITIFLFFLALISFFSIRIRRRVRELLVIEPRENIIGLLVDFFSTPVIAAGKWLSEKFSKINVLVFILDFLIEAPFKLFVEIAEEWTKYVRERKEDISQ